MATAFKDPTSDESTFTGTWSGTAGSRYTLVDDYPDAAGADFLTHGTTAGVGSFLYTGTFAIPAGSTTISVQVLYYDKKTASQASSIGARLKVGGNYYNANPHNPVNGVWTSRSDNWANNPNGGLAWTVDDINGVGAKALQGMGWNSGDASPTINLASIRLQVTYTPPPDPTRGRVSWLQFAAPLARTRGRVSWAQLAVPSLAATPTRGRVSWAQWAVPDLTPTRGRVSWLQWTVPLIGTRGRVSVMNLAVPALATRGRISWVEWRVPSVGSAGEGVSHRCGCSLSVITSRRR